MMTDWQKERKRNEWMKRKMAVGSNGEAERRRDIRNRREGFQILDLDISVRRRRNERWLVEEHGNRIDREVDTFRGRVGLNC